MNLFTIILLSFFIYSAKASESCSFLFQALVELERPGSVLKIGSKVHIQLSDTSTKTIAVFLGRRVEKEGGDRAFVFLDQEKNQLITFNEKVVEDNLGQACSQGACGLYLQLKQQDGPNCAAHAALKCLLGSGDSNEIDYSELSLAFEEADSRVSSNKNINPKTQKRSIDRFLGERSIPFIRISALAPN